MDLSTFLSGLWPESLWGRAAMLVIFADFIFLFILMVYGRKLFPNRVCTVKWYSGGDGIDALTEGELKIEGEFVKFVPIKASAKSIEIPLSKIASARYETEPFGVLAVAKLGRFLNVEGWLQYIFIEYESAADQKCVVKFARRNRSNDMGRLSKAISEAVQARLGVSKEAR